MYCTFLKHKRVGCTYHTQLETNLAILDEFAYVSEKFEDNSSLTIKSHTDHTLRAKKGCEKMVTNTFRAIMRAGLVGDPDQLRITS